MIRENKANWTGCCSAYKSRALPASVNMSRAKTKVFTAVKADITACRSNRIDNAV